MEQQNELQNEKDNVPQSESTLSLICLILGVVGFLLMYLSETIGYGVFGASFWCGVIGLYFGKQAKKIKKTTIGKVGRGICIYVLIFSLITNVIGAIAMLA